MLNGLRVKKLFREVKIIENAFGIELSKAVAGTESPDDALKNAQAAIQKIIAR